MDLPVVLSAYLLIILYWSGAHSFPQAEKIYSFTPHTTDDKILQQDKTFWNKVGLEHLKKTLNLEKEGTKKVAKNVIIFIGDGMGLTTITSGRIYKGQRTYGRMGEEHNMAFESFPNVALVKTYAVDMQVPDSGSTATALFSGVKTRYDSIGVDVNCNQNEFNPDAYERCKVESLMTWAQNENKSTGIVTNTRISHATPGATFAHVPYRYWECDSKVPKKYRDIVKDISRQLVEDLPGRDFKVILGGGYQAMGHVSYDQGGFCVREDGKNLTKAWMKMHEGQKYVFASNTGDLEQVGDDTEYLMGLFWPNHMPYELVRDKSKKGTPSLTEMTKKALQILQKDENGYVLMVEGGLIDQAHHKNYAKLAMEEVSEFDNAIQYAIENTDDETLIIVTADHSHAMTLDGYSKRGNDILGYTIENPDKNFTSFLTLSYANGPGFDYQFDPSNPKSRNYPWRDLEDPRRDTDPYYQHVAAWKTVDETHGGEDVAAYAKGPNANLIRGVVEQNYIPYVISYSACIGPQKQLNPHCNGSGRLHDFKFNLFLVFTFSFILSLYK